MRTYVTSTEMTLIQLEEQMLEILGSAHDHSIWGARYQAVFHEDRSPKIINNK